MYIWGSLFLILYKVYSDKEIEQLHTVGIWFKQSQHYTGQIILLEKHSASLTNQQWATDIEDWVRVHEAIARTMQEVRDGTENNNENDGDFSLFIYIILMTWLLSSNQKLHN